MTLECISIRHKRRRGDAISLKSLVREMYSNIVISDIISNNKISAARDSGCSDPPYTRPYHDDLRCYDPHKSVHRQQYRRSIDEYCSFSEEY